MSSSEILVCPHAEFCSVCSWISTPYKEQKNKKLEIFKIALSEKAISIPEKITFLTPAKQGIRDRLDLTYENGSYGFYRKDNKEIFPIESCPLMSEALFAFFQELQKIKLPIKKGSLRLRVSPHGEKGLWLDFSNEDIRDLLSEKKTLQTLMELAFVEIGQRRKKLTQEMKLKDPEFKHWTRTWVQSQAIDLYSTVGSFSQAGDLANQTLIRELEAFFEKCASTHWVEFGAGSGNLTFPLAGRNRFVQALEFESLALEGLEKTLSCLPDFRDRIQLSLGDYQRKKSYSFHRDEGVLVNPPRSGLQKFLDPLFEIAPSERPRDFVYMSCFLESFVKDSLKLKDLGYELQQISLVDQFPHSPHFEILSHWYLRSS